MPKAAPAARKLANELTIDLHELTGTGKSGYITKADVWTRWEADQKANGKTEQGPPFTHEMKEDYDGKVYPVSELYKMRFRQDDPVSGDMVGDDLLAIRPKAAGGRFRSHDGVMGFFVADRGYFLEPVAVEPKDAPDETGQRPVLSEPTTDAADSLAVSE